MKWALKHMSFLFLVLTFVRQSKYIYLGGIILPWSPLHSYLKLNAVPALNFEYECKGEQGKMIVSIKTAQFT